MQQEPLPENTLYDEIVAALIASEKAITDACVGHFTNNKPITYADLFAMGIARRSLAARWKTRPSGNGRGFPEPATEEELLALLRPCPEGRLKIWRVDNKVGNVRNTGPERSRRRVRAGMVYDSADRAS
jgi:hypothetical protein